MEIWLSYFDAYDGVERIEQVNYAEEDVAAYAEKYMEQSNYFFVERENCWVFYDKSSSNYKYISSVRDEEMARFLAEEYPEAIYFFAENVTHPYA